MMMQNRSVAIVLLWVGLAGQPTMLLAEDDPDRATYTEYVPDFHAQPPKDGCENPHLDRTNFGSTLAMCEGMYKRNDFTEDHPCESEALFKQRNAPHLLQQSDLKWLANVVNRKRACMNLLADKGKLGVRDRIYRWLDR
jgi:hypothetical protein